MDQICQNDWKQTVLLTSEEQMTMFAETVRHELSAGCVLLLSGPIGAGKSYFARALIRSLLADHGLVEDIPSPTYTLVQTYLAGDLEIWHCDLYRLCSEDEIHELGLYDAMSTSLCLIEWPEKLEPDLTKDALRLDFGIPENADHRSLSVQAHGSKWDGFRAALERFESTAHRDG